MGLFFFAVGAGVLVLLYFLLVRGTKSPEVMQFGRLRAVQLEVQNGSGEPKLAQKLTDYLRARGFDVVEVGNYRAGSLPRTVVIDRAGNRHAAELVAASLGVPETGIQQKIDRDLYLDVTVVIGKDYQTLKAFQQ